MAKSHLKVVNIVSSATEAAWSQSYHAGGVTAIVSVRRINANKEDSPSLSIVGKDLLNTFESEYFTLENKNLASIKSAVDATYEKSKDTHDISLIVTAVIQNAVYVVLAGEGKIQLIRNNTMATLLEQKDAKEVISASGFLETDDVMILETLSFSEKIPSSTLLETLTSNTVEDAAEILSPTIHKDQTGSEAALIFSYHEEEGMHMATPQPIRQTEEPKEELEKPLIQQQASHPISQNPERGKRLSHMQRLFLTIAAIIALVFIGTIYFSLQKKQTNQNAALFSSLYPPAERKYEEGLGLKDLNASLAKDDFTQAQKMLNDAKTKFPKDSSEEKQILVLLDKVNNEISPSTSTSTPSSAPVTDMTKTDATTAPFVGFAAKHLDAKYFAQDTSNYYFADNTGITKVVKTTGKATQIIKNSTDWKSIGGFDTYLGNMYVVDIADGIDKYPVAASGFGDKTAYFTGTVPDLSKNVSMAIDSSVWLLATNGTISKYTRGKADSFTLSGLTTSLSSPTRVVTTVDDTNLYILDNGNSRIVVIKKDTGSFVAQYYNPTLKGTTFMDVSEKTKTAYVLVSGTIYQMTFK